MIRRCSVVETIRQHDADNVESSMRVGLTHDLSSIILAPTVGGAALPPMKISPEMALAFAEKLTRICRRQIQAQRGAFSERSGFLPILVFLLA